MGARKWAIGMSGDNRVSCTGWRYHQYPVLFSNHVDLFAGLTTLKKSQDSYMNDITLNASYSSWAQTFYDPFESESDFIITQSFACQCQDFLFWMILHQWLARNVNYAMCVYIIWLWCYAYHRLPPYYGSFFILKI
jgi:hypothetical protein